MKYTYLINVTWYTRKHMDQNRSGCISLEGEEEVVLTPFEYSKILDIQQNIFELLTVGYNEKVVLEKLCIMAERLLPNSVASVMILDTSTGLMNVISAPSIPQVGHDALQGLKPGPGGGSCGNAVFRNEAQYVRDTKSDERWTDIRQIAYDFNLCSCWSMPIRNATKQAVGSFALSSFEHRSPSGFHKRLLEICAFIVNIVLKRSEYERELDEKQKELNILGTAMKYASDGMIITDSDNNIIEVNSAFLDTFGYTDKSEVIGKNPRILASGKHDHHFYHQMWDAIIRENHWSGEIWNKRTNGEIFPEWMSVSAVGKNDAGVQNYLAVFTDLSELHHNQEQLIHLAYFDQLTGLPNRQKIRADMDEKIPTACAITNIDDFKEINDFFGIAAGDSILRQMGEWFSEMECSPYRIGGDEFAIVFYDNLSWETLHERITTMLSRLEAKVFAIGDENLTLRMSVGIAMGKENLLTRADIALHTAKEKKIPVALYEEQQNVEDKYRHNIAMAAHIRHAVNDNRIICHYQPIVNLSTGKIDKYETLVRMLDEEGNIVPPMEFLSIAKKTKIYPAITRSVIKQACDLFATREEEFSINLSDSDMRDAQTVREILDTIVKTGTASRIVFEILESEGIESYEEVTQFITQAKALGAKIAIDDFGTGYSNFENILMLNVDYIKIDGSLIRGISQNTRHSIIVDTIVDFAKKIGAKTIAEFVSDKEIYDAIIQHEINYSQGYYTGKPEPMN